MARLTVLKHMLNRAKHWLNMAREWNRFANSSSGRVRYTSVPVWKPWRDF
jgi:hypothetical protein